uniref:Protein NATD1 n=1 Tax=Strongyloides venezuelensis TaxID=75913 RepID=A0A0K0FRA4_STRVS
MDKSSNSDGWEGNVSNNIKHDSNNGKFFVKMNDGSMSLLEYNVTNDNIMNINHTETPPQWRGRGLAAALVLHAAGYALRKKMKINAVCWYADKILSNQQQFKHLLK